MHRNKNGSALKMTSILGEESLKFYRMFEIMVSFHLILRSNYIA